MGGSSPILLINYILGWWVITLHIHYIWGEGVRDRRIPNYVIKLCSLIPVVYTLKHLKDVFNPELANCLRFWNKTKTNCKF